MVAAALLAVSSGRIVSWDRIDGGVEGEDENGVQWKEASVDKVVQAVGLNGSNGRWRRASESLNTFSLGSYKNGDH